MFLVSGWPSAVTRPTAGRKTPFNELFADWRGWCEVNGGPSWGGKTFSKALDERGFVRGKTGSTRCFKGLTLVEKTGEEDAGRTGSGRAGRALCERLAGRFGTGESCFEPALAGLGHLGHLRHYRPYTVTV